MMQWWQHRVCVRHCPMCSVCWMVTTFTGAVTPPLGYERLLYREAAWLRQGHTELSGVAGTWAQAVNISGHLQHLMMLYPFILLSGQCAIKYWNIYFSCFNFSLLQSTVQRTSYVCSQMFVYKLNDFSPNLAVNPLDNRFVHPWASGLSADPRGPQPARGNRAPPNPNCSWDVPSSVNTGILFLGDKKGPIQLIKTCSFSNFPAIL